MNIIILLFLFFIIDLYLLFVNYKKTESINQLYKEATQLQLQHQDKQQELNKQITELTSQKVQILQDIESEKNKINSIYQQEKDRINQAISDYKQSSVESCEHYSDVLEQAYNKAEEKYKKQIDTINAEIAQCKSELEQVRQNRAAAQEAIRKEKQIKADKANYALVPNTEDLDDIIKLERIKLELKKPRILAMLIWQTYYLPLAKKKFIEILGSEQICGIYKITNQETDECYIGQSVDIYKRWCDHVKCGLGIDTPVGNKLYKAMNEYGVQKFTFELLQKCTRSELDNQEQYFISLYEADKYGYNGRNQK